MAEMHRAALSSLMVVVIAAVRAAVVAAAAVASAFAPIKSRRTDQQTFCP